MSKILIYPILRKSDYQLNSEKSTPSEKELDELTDHYMSEIIKNLKNHGFKMNKHFLKDMSVTADFLKSAIFRNVGKYHHLQDTIDQLDFVEENSKKE